MEKRSIHKNLDTSFVNLSALIKYLRKRQFVGNVEVQLNGYRADIKLNSDNSISVHEHDQISGRISEGEEAFQRLLIRSREPGGTIDVFQTIEQNAESSKPPMEKSAEPGANIPPKQPDALADPQIPKPIQPVPFENKVAKPIAKKAKAAGVAQTNHNPPAPNPKHVQQEPILREQTKEPVANKTKRPSLPDFPFKLSNKVEGMAQKTLSSDDWQNVLKITVELLTIVDRSLASANLNFNAEFGKICTEIADDYPFLNSDTGTFSYARGKIEMSEQISEKIFVSGISEALRNILVKLSKSRKYSDIYNLTAQRIQSLIEKRSDLYKKYGITSQIRRIVSP